MKFILRHAWDHLQQQMRRWLTDTVSVLFRFMGDEPRPGPPGTTVRLTADFITCPEWGAQQQTESFDTRLSFTRSKDCGCCSLRGHPRSDACCRDAPNVGATTRRQAHTARKAAGESCASSSGWCSSIAASCCDTVSPRYTGRGLRSPPGSLYETAGAAHEAAPARLLYLPQFEAARCHKTLYEHQHHAAKSG